MTYRISGLSPEQFAHLTGASDEVLAAAGAARVTAGADKGWPCRISLEDAKAGESLILIHHVSHDVATPYRWAYAIYVRENVTETAQYIDEVPPVFKTRTLGLRGFDKNAMIKTAKLAEPGDADVNIRALFEDEDIAYIDAHNATYGCFAARVERA